MAFRADEAARTGVDEVINYLIRPSIYKDEDERTNSRYVLQDIIDELGPVVDSYPSWHPLVRNHDDRNPTTYPCRESGYKGLDHTKYFVNGFITCPYNDGQEVLDSVLKLPRHHAAYITAERLDAKFYNNGTTAILVKCNWERPLEVGGTIPQRLAIPLMLEQEVKAWEWASMAETWETMRHYLLGSPHGSRSSLFVSKETGLAIKKMWEMMIYSGMYGPIKV